MSSRLDQGDDFAVSAFKLDVDTGAGLLYRVQVWCSLSDLESFDELTVHGALIDAAQSVVQQMQDRYEGKL